MMLIRVTILKHVFAWQKKKLATVNQFPNSLKIFSHLQNHKIWVNAVFYSL
jgi:hypothetical protein